MKRTHAIFSDRVGQSCLGLSGTLAVSYHNIWNTLGALGNGDILFVFAYVMPTIPTGIWSMFLACDGSLLDGSIPGLFVKLREYSPVLYFMWFKSKLFSLLLSLIYPSHV